MRLTASLLMALTVALAKNPPVPDLSGVWVTDPAKLDFGTSSSPTPVSLDVTQDGNGLKVIEIVAGKQGTYVVERQYLFERRGRVAEGDVGTARTSGRMTILRCSDQLERWIISVDGSELIVQRWRRDTRTASPQILIFRRTERIVNWSGESQIYNTWLDDQSVTARCLQCG